MMTDNLATVIVRANNFKIFKIKIKTKEIPISMSKETMRCIILIQAENLQTQKMNKNFMVKKRNLIPIKIKLKAVQI